MLPNRTLTPAIILGIFRRRLWLILILPALTLFGALLYSSTIRNLYQSDMLIAIIPQRVPDSFVRSTVTLRADERLDEISVQVMSRTNLGRIIEEMDLYPEQRAGMPLEDVIALMRTDLIVGLEPVRRGPRGPEPPHAFHVRFTYTDPATAARVTQKIGAIFVEQNSLGRGALAQATNEFLESQLAEARRRLEQQERKVESFRQRHGKELPTQLQSNLEAGRSLQLQLQAIVESIARDRDRKLMLERLYRESMNDLPAVSSVNTPPSGDASTANLSLSRQLVNARNALSTLEARYKSDHPDVVRARRQIADLEQRVALEQSATGSTAAPTPTVEQLDPIEAARRENQRQMVAEIESLDRQTAFKQGEQKRLQTEISEYQRRVEAVPGIESEWVALSRDYDTNQLAYRELLTKSEAARVAVNLEEREIGEQFRIVDVARVPVHPVSSIRGMVNSGGFVVGLLIALGITAFLELRDSSYRTESDVKDVLALPVLAIVPPIIDDNQRNRDRKQKLAILATGMACLAGASYLTWTLKLWNSLI